MADIKITQMPAATSADGVVLAGVDKAGKNVKVPTSLLVGGGGGETPAQANIIPPILVQIDSKGVRVKPAFYSSVLKDCYVGIFHYKGRGHFKEADGSKGGWGRNIHKYVLTCIENKLQPIKADSFGTESNINKWLEVATLEDIWNNLTHNNVPNWAGTSNMYRVINSNTSEKENILMDGVPRYSLRLGVAFVLPSVNGGTDINIFHNPGRKQSEIYRFTLISDGYTISRRR